MSLNDQMTYLVFFMFLTCAIVVLIVFFNFSFKVIIENIKVKLVTVRGCLFMC